MKKKTFIYKVINTKRPLWWRSLKRLNKEGLKGWELFAVQVDRSHVYHLRKKS